MRTKLTVRRPGDVAVDLVVVTDIQATVGEVAQALAARGCAAPDSRPTAPTLAVRHRDAARALDPAQLFADSAIQSGSVVEVAAAFIPPPDILGVLHVVSGPDAGAKYPLRTVSTVVGRGATADVNLSDTMVSKEHARIVVTEAPDTAAGARVHAVDLNSANGLQVNNELVRRAELTDGDTVVLGESGLRVVLEARDPIGGSLQSEFNRSPQLDVVFPPRELAGPQPPQRPARRPFPLIPLLVPIAMGLAILAITRSTYAVIFVAMSPLLLLGTWGESRIAERKSYRRALEDYRSELSSLEQQLSRLAEDEREARQAETPEPADVVTAVLQRTRGMWARRPDRPQWLTVRVGTGRVEARVTIGLPQRNQALPELWAELERLQERSRSIQPVPVVVEFPQVGALGVAGDPAAARGVVDALVVQLVGLHSPAELVVAVLTDLRGEQRWSWLRWTPHTSSEHSPLAAPHLARDDASCRSLISSVEEVVSARQSGEVSHAPAVLLIVDDQAAVQRARLVWVAEHGPAVGVHVLHIAPGPDRLLAACGAYLMVDEARTGRLFRCEAGQVVEPVALEPLPAQQVAGFARSMAPLVDAGALAPSQSDLPASVSMVSLIGRELVSAEARIRERWVDSGSLVGADGRQRGGQHHLSALVGVSNDGPFYLDLRTQGPHALVGGTTGAGKSEFLQTWVIGLATTYSPRRVTFLFVDYKGGAAFGDCTKLPHSVGMITDLTPNLFGRTLVSLRAELRRREGVLAARKAKDLVELEKRGDPEAPPSLVIVVDEFAALARDIPEFVDSMVDIAQRGRSLGVHLILATQRPAGVIKENLRANTNLRVALRMADTADSTDVLGSKESAMLSPELPGRGYARTGPGRLAAFQTAYVGGWTSDKPEPAAIAVETLQFGQSSSWSEPEALLAVASFDRNSPTDLQWLVGTVVSAAQTARIEKVQPPWLPPLDLGYPLEDLAVEDRVLPLAQRDDPDRQRQYAVGFDPDREGNLAVYGTGGSGKSTLLRTLATAAYLRTLAGDPTHVYAVDFGAGGLSMLTRLPNVGALISGDDTDLLTRLMRWVLALIAERARSYPRAGAANLSEYRANTGQASEARILVLVDAAQVFRQRHESRSGLWEQFLSVAADGRAVGVHVCVAADRPMALPGALNSVLQKRVYLRMSEEDYAIAGLAGSALPAGSPPGRGHLDGYEVQIGVLRGEPSIALQALHLTELAATPRHGPAAEPHRIERLPELVPMPSLPASLDGELVLGLDDITLLPVPVTLRSSFLVAGPPGSGRTTTLAAVAVAAARSGRYLASAYLGLARTPVRSILSWHAEASSLEEIAVLAQKLAGALADPSHPRTLVVVEDLHQVAVGPAEAELLKLARTCVAGGHAFVTDVGVHAKMFSELSQLLKNQRQGFILRPGGLTDGQNLLFTNTPQADKGDPPGRGYLISGGGARKLQVGYPEPV